MSEQGIPIEVSNALEQIYKITWGKDTVPLTCNMELDSERVYPERMKQIAKIIESITPNIRRSYL